MRSKFFSVLLCFALCLSVLYGCGSPANSPAPAQTATAAPAPTTFPSKGPDPTPTPSLTSAPVDTAAVQMKVSQIWQTTLKIDLSEAIPESLFKGGRDSLYLNGDDESRAWLLELQAALKEQMERAWQATSAQIKERWGVTGEMDMTFPNWQLIYTALMGQGDQEEGIALLKELITPVVHVTEEGDQLNIALAIGPYDYREAAKLAKDEMSGKFLYAYIYTVYDQEAREVDYVQREETGNLEKGIVWPLKSHTNLRKTWYYARDKGARKHTGTDIWAKENTEIYSCTDGTVQFVGSNKGMGNAVIIEDEYGYEFHYYHMVRLTDFLKEGDAVKAGQLVGHVGNTGNSVRDHLHLTIVAPDGYFVNPYPYLKEIEP